MGSNIIITGIPRSGTSLMCRIIDSLASAICLNESMPHKWHTSLLNYAFLKIRLKLFLGMRVENRTESDGMASSDTQRVSAIREAISTQKKSGRRLLLASKRTIPYLEQLGSITDKHYKVIAMVRNPHDTISSHLMIHNPNVPMCNICPPNPHSCWHNVGLEFNSDDEIERLAQAWNYLAGRVLEAKDKLYMQRLEDLLEDPESALASMSEWLGEDISAGRRFVRSHNRHYAPDASILRALDAYCPNRIHLGYK